VSSHASTVPAGRPDTTRHDSRSPLLTAHPHGGVPWEASASTHKGLQWVQARQVAQETHQAHTTRPDCDADEMDGNHSPMSESESGTFWKALGDLGAYIEGVMP
jgi:hypothetical protein